MAANSYIDQYCMQILTLIAKEDEYRLHGASTMSAYGLVFLINEIMVNDRKKVLEFGSGISTLLIARAIKQYNLDVRLTSVENDLSWLNKLKECAQRSNMDDVIDFIHAPLVPDARVGGNNKWYDQILLSSSLGPDQKFDMVIIDGPPAHEASIALSRYGAIPFVKDRLTTCFSIFLDDANREGERSVLESWKEQFGIHFRTYNNRIAASQQTGNRNSHPSFVTLPYKRFKVEKRVLSTTKEGVVQNLAPK